ncbi:MAG: imidazolonepropionase [Halobacteriales archaeon]
MTEAYTIVHDAAEVVVGPGDEEALAVQGAGAVVVEDGRVAAVGSTDELTRSYPPENAAEAVDAAGKTVLPGFVDAHTHAVFAGDRADEFVARLRGASYQALLAAGGGIHRTVRAVRAADRATLTANLCEALDVMLAHGATTVEVKSGYGLDAEAEVRLLKAIAAADERHPVDLVPTYLGAHAIPQGVERGAYVDEVVDEHLPAVAELATFCDVFCDVGAFTVAEAERILRAGLELGLEAKIHAEEFERLGGAQLAAELGATSADHLLEATATDARALAEVGVVPVLLPATALTLGVDYADAAMFTEAGSWPAVASDFNPNCPAPSMAFALQLACHGMGMDPAVAVRGATAAAAAAVGRPEAGRLEPDAPGDLVVVDASTHEHVPYPLGVNPVEVVVKGGAVVHG